jgi:hypothetical protein
METRAGGVLITQSYLVEFLRYSTSVDVLFRARLVVNLSHY